MEHATNKQASRKRLAFRTGAGQVTGHVEGFRAEPGRYVTIPGASRSLSLDNADRINGLAMEQAILADQNETPMDAEQAARINAASLRNESERRRFKHDFARHVRNIAECNPFYE